MKHFFYSSVILAALSVPLSADAELNLENYHVSGNIFVFDDMQHVGWLLGEILVDDYFNLREVIREYDIETLILDSPGGDLYEGLYMAAVLHDRSIKTYIPTGAYCESSCANMFFAGHARVVNGNLGVHQFSSSRTLEEQELTQVTVADIISFLNEFSTPPIVYEKMFLSGELYYFSESEISRINRRQELFSDDELQIYDQLFEEIIEILYVEENAVDQSSDPDNSEAIEENKEGVIDFEFLRVMSALNDGVMDIEVFCDDPNELPERDLFFYSTSYWDTTKTHGIKGFIFNGSTHDQLQDDTYFINGALENSERWEEYPFKVTFNISSQSTEPIDLENIEFQWFGDLDQDNADRSAMRFKMLQNDQESCIMNFFIGGL